MRALLIALSFTLSACATVPATPINPATAAPQTAPPVAVSEDGEAVWLALSGGGARAAAFSLGAMDALREIEMGDGRSALDHVSLVTSVSGGSVIAAYFGQHGPGGLDGFRGAYLDKDWDSQLNLSPFWPGNWLAAWRGGLNGPNRLADWLDSEVYAGGPMRDLWSTQGPQIWLNAVDLYNGAVFTFTPQTFNALCSDLGSVRVGDAVAASMAVPVVFEPVVIEPRREDCAPLPAWIAAAPADRAAPLALRHAARALQSYRHADELAYVHLVDGGVIDNLGLTALSVARYSAGNAYAPFAPEAAARLRRLSVLVVNAENIRDVHWQMDAHGPNGPQALDITSDIFIEAANRAAYDRFRAVAARWQEELRAWRCGLSAEDAARLTGAASDWRCDDVSISIDMIGFDGLDPDSRERLGVLATRVTLPREDIDALIAGGRAGVAASPVAQALAR